MKDFHNRQAAQSTGGTIGRRFARFFSQCSAPTGGACACVKTHFMGQVIRLLCKKCRSVFATAQRSGITRTTAKGARDEGHPDTA
jgi:hypothetical protein